MSITEATHEMTETVRDAVQVVGLPAKIAEESFDQRDHNGDPVGPLAVIKARVLSWLFRRATRSHRRPLV